MIKVTNVETIEAAKRLHLDLQPTHLSIQMSKLQNSQYMVYGDLSSDSTSENYPMVVLCPDCVNEDSVVIDNGVSEDDCEECGEESRVDFENLCLTNAKTKEQHVLCPSCLDEQKSDGVIFEHDTIEESREDCELCEAQS